MRILVTGSTGLIGQELCPMLEKEGWQFWATNKKIFDITNDKLAEEISSRISPQNHLALIQIMITS